MGEAGGGGSRWRDFSPLAPSFPAAGALPPSSISPAQEAPAFRTMALSPGEPSWDWRKVFRALFQQLPRAAPVGSDTVTPGRSGERWPGLGHLPAEGHNTQQFRELPSGATESSCQVSVDNRLCPAPAKTVTFKSPIKQFSDTSGTQPLTLATELKCVQAGNVAPGRRLRES